MRKVNKFKFYHDRNVKCDTYNMGDRVWLKNSATKVGQTGKFRKRWTGPFTVINVLSNVNYRIKPDMGTKKLQIVHVNRLKKCFTAQLPDEHQMELTESEIESDIGTPKRKQRENKLKTSKSKPKIQRSKKRDRPAKKQSQVKFAEEEVQLKISEPLVNAEVGLDQDGDGFEGDTDTSDEIDARYHETEVGYRQLDLDWDVDVPNTDIILEGSTSEGASQYLLHSDGLASDISSSNDIISSSRQSGHNGLISNCVS